MRYNMQNDMSTTLFTHNIHYNANILRQIQIIFNMLNVNMIVRIHSFPFATTEWHQLLKSFLTKTL